MFTSCPPFRAIWHQPFGSHAEQCSGNHFKQSGVAEVLRHALKVDFWDIDAMADCIYGLLNYEGFVNLF